MKVIACDGPDCQEEIAADDWKAALNWAQVRLELVLPGKPDGQEETTANAARSISELNFHSDACWQNWRRNGDPIDWPTWEVESAGSQLLRRNREISPGEIPKGKVVNPEAE